ncbi:MAG: adenylate kinase [Bifidobacteriaceae bacterium]|nr:adenylate kinase [Bifidobacteriaceae bacterium]
MNTRIVLLGPPGSGKGTQAAGLAKAAGVPAVSTGAIFRDHLARETELGLKAREYMRAGQLVPDHLTNALVAARLAEPDAEAGFVLDGYPRNLGQVEALDRFLGERGAEVDQAIELAIPREHVIARLLKRAEIEGREDDTEPVIVKRLAVYHAETEPVSGAYAARGAFTSVDGLGTVEEVAARLHSAAETRSS